MSTTPEQTPSAAARAQRVNGGTLVFAGLLGLLGTLFDVTIGDGRISGFQAFMVVALFGSFLLEGGRELRAPASATAETKIRWSRVIPVGAFAAVAIAYFAFGVG